MDTVLGDRNPTVADLRALRFTTRVINESMRLYPQPPVLIRRYERCPLSTAPRCLRRRCCCCCC